LLRSYFKKVAKPMQSIIVIIAFFVFFLVILLVVPALMTRRAIKAVLKIFRQHGALDEETAMTPRELGLEPLSFAKRIMKTRDYKPRALDILGKIGVLQTTAEGKIFLSEEKLLTSGIKQNIF
jgi:hypothetical protein